MSTAILLAVLVLSAISVIILPDTPAVQQVLDAGKRDPYRKELPYQ